MTTCALILHYGSVQDTLGCVESIRRQVNRIVIVDNSEEQDAAGVLCAALDTNAEHSDDFFAVLKPGRNLGFAAGVNFGLKSGQFEGFAACLLLNNDAKATPDMVECMKATLEAHERLAVVAPRIEGSGAPALFWYHRYFAIMTKKRIPGSFPYLTGACLLVPADIATPPLFDERFFMYGDDVALAWKLRHQGSELVVDEAAMIRHDGGGSRDEVSWHYEYHTARSNFLLADVLSSGKGEARLLRLARILTLAARALLRSLRWRSLIPLRAYWKAFGDTRLACK